MFGMFTEGNGTVPLIETIIFWGWILFAVISVYFTFRRTPFISIWPWRVFFIFYVVVAITMPLLMLAGGYCFVDLICVPQII